MSADYYKTLGVNQNASPDEIKKAYRKLAHQHHPDKSGGDETKFKEINEAYQILSDPKKRSQYDQFGSSGFTSGKGGFDGFDFSNFGGFNSGRAGRGFDFDLEDIFDIFGGGFSQRGPRQASEEANRGSDIEITLTADFYEMARGAVKRVELTKENACEECRGIGAKPGEAVIDCSVCNGKGEVKETMASLFGNFVRIYPCKICRGSGQIPKENCHNCLGEGRKRGRKILDVTIPAGIHEGEILVVKGQGQAGFRSGRPGDLYIRLKINPDKKFVRNGNDVIYNLTLKVTEAILGTKLKIPTLDGEREIEIPAGSQTGDELRLKGSGIHGHRKGDQIVKIKIGIPKHLSGKARRLVEELSQEV